MGIKNRMGYLNSILQLKIEKDMLIDKIKY